MAPAGATPVRRVAKPGAASYDPMRAAAIRYGVIALMLLISIAVIYVLTPLPYVSAHIIYPQAIRGFGSNGVSRASTICGIPRHSTYIVSSSILLRFPTTPCRILPFSLGRQAERVSALAIQLQDSHYRRTVFQTAATAETLEPAYLTQGWDVFLSNKCRPGSSKRSFRPGRLLLRSH